MGVHEPAGDPEESRLARAVLADERVHLAGAAVEADVGQRTDRAELAGHAAHLENELAGSRLSSGSPAHPSGYISASTESGTSDVPDTVGVTRFGSQSSAVT